MPEPHVSIIILNWNGWQDTIECLESVLKSDYENYNIILIDNFSTNNSISKITKWAAGGEVTDIKTKIPSLIFPLIPKPVPIFKIKNIQNINRLTLSYKNSIQNNGSKSIIFIQNPENVGFAAGNNIGIKISERLFSSNYFFLLNNDTVIEKNAVSTLIKYLEKNENAGAVTSAIYHYSSPETIHNLGGKLTRWGSAKYYTNLSDLNKKRVSFVTGCALMIQNRILKEFGLLSEDFFFGEEDFEFSMRLKKNKVPVTCLTQSKVYHKISFSADLLYKEGSLQRKFLHVFHRITNMRKFLLKPEWVIWRYLIFIYTFFWLTIKYHIKTGVVLKFIKYLYSYTQQYKIATKSAVENILREIDI